MSDYGKKGNWYQRLVYGLPGPQPHIYTNIVLIVWQDALVVDYLYVLKKNPHQVRDCSILKIHKDDGFQTPAGVSVYFIK